MSRYDKQLRKSIQRIVLDSPALTSALDAYANRGGFGAAVGSAASDAEESRLCCDGSTGDPNPGTEERDPDSGGQDGLDPNDPANLGDMGEGSLAGLTDCATGVAICFDGGGFIPPDDWDEPDEGPVLENYIEGEYWYITAPYYSSTPCGAIYTYFDGSNSPLVAISCSYAGNDVVNYETQKGEEDPVDQQSTLYRRACSPSDPESYCPTEPPREESWPSDGCVNLAIIGGKVVGSKYDPENGGSYSAPRDSIDLCDGNGNQISLAPSASGGWKTIDAINGGDGYLYDSSGQQIARISGDEFTDPNV